MKTTILLATYAITLGGCTGTAPGAFNTGNDTSFPRESTTTCPGVIDSGNPIYQRYPLRCGPQAQAIPR